MTVAERTQQVIRLALQAGFDRVGVAPAGPVLRADYLRGWLERGYAGEMEYLARHHPLRLDPRGLLEGARSVIVVAHNYRQPSRPVGSDASPGGTEPLGHGLAGSSPDRLRGRVAQYAWGRDYHKIIRRKLHRLVDELRRVLAEPFDARVCVDTAPIVEREFALMAGIGWIGKNTLVLHQELGSFFFLGEILTTLELEPSAPATDHCGTCTRCLDACPTGALIAPRQMDATRCISYLTIEHRGRIAPDLVEGMGDWVYGCDICQEVCPYNHKAPAAREPAYAPQPHNPLVPAADLETLLNLDEHQYRQYLQGSAMKRAKLSMLQRNAAIAQRNLLAGAAPAARPDSLSAPSVPEPAR